jgi:1-acyl-sn-glycerol-3-phosphate acyltransferase
MIKDFFPVVDPNLKGWPRFLSYIDIFGLFQKDPFGNSMLLKRIMIFVVGSFTFWRLNIVNRVKVSGVEHVKNLPPNNVFFISNHQTYFADVIVLYQIFCSIKWGFKNMNWPIFLLAPRVRMFYVAAKETMMNGGLLPKVFASGGALLVERSWRAEGKSVSRTLDTSASDKVSVALQWGWVIQFPQGTTSPFAPVRKGTAHLIKANNPIVVPVVINGFRRAFDKRGLGYKKRNTELTVKFKEPIRFDPNLSVDEIVAMVTDIIEQDMPERVAILRSQTES